MRKKVEKKVTRPTRKAPVKKAPAKTKKEEAFQYEELEGVDYWTTKKYEASNGYEVEYTGELNIQKLEEIAREFAESEQPPEPEPVEEDLYTEFQVEKDFTQDSIEKKAHEFITLMINSRRSIMYPEEAQLLEDYYNNIFKLNESVKNCDICAIRMFKRLKNYLKIK